MKSWLKRYWLSGIFTIVGAITILIAIGTVTIWKPPSTIAAEIKSKDNVNLIATTPGMLSLYDSDVKIEVVGKGKVSLAIGYSRDVSGWVGKQPHLSVTGLASYQELKGKMVSGQDKVLPLDANNATDMWHLYQTSDKAKISTTWNKVAGNWSLIAYSEKAPITLKLQWQQEYQTPLFYPLLAVGIVLLLVGIILGIVLYRIAIATQRELEETILKRKALEQLQGDTEGEISPHTIPIATIPEGKQRPSRKKLREARENGEEKIEVDGLEYSTGLMPVIKLDENGNPIKPSSSSAVKEEPETAESNEGEQPEESESDDSNPQPEKENTDEK